MREANPGLRFADPGLTSVGPSGRQELTNEDALNRGCHYEYDQMNRLTAQTAVTMGTKEYVYDGAGRLAQFGYPGYWPTAAPTITPCTREWVYDRAGRVSAVQLAWPDVTPTPLVTYEYNVASERTKAEYPYCGAETEWPYDATYGHLLGIAHKNVSGEVVASVTYEYDLDGLRTSVELVGLLPREISLGFVMASEAWPSR